MIRLLVAALASTAIVANADDRLDADRCVARALGASGAVSEADAKVAEWRARLAEVRSLQNPRVSGAAFAAPMFRVEGSPVAPDVRRDLSEWGPYLHLDALVTQPLDVFGRAAAAARAADERTKAEEASAARVRNAVAEQVRRAYHQHLYAKSIRALLARGRTALDEALAVAQRDHEDATGNVTTVDLQKLEYHSSDLARHELEAESAEGLTLAALKHAMGLADHEPLSLADDALPPASTTPIRPLPQLLADASNRPEFQQISHGTSAALSLEQAERLAAFPALFVAGQLSADWTPMRPDAANPYAFDPFNRVMGGAAIGVQFDLSPRQASARAEQAAAMRAQVDALAVFARTGIPLEVRAARDDVERSGRIAKVSADGASAARKWLVFAQSALESGTGEAEDVLEGLAAYLLAKKAELDATRDAHFARARLACAVGTTGP